MRTGELEVEDYDYDKKGHKFILFLSDGTFVTIDMVDMFTDFLEDMTTEGTEEEKRRALQITDLVKQLCGS